MSEQNNSGFPFPEMTDSDFDFSSIFGGAVNAGSAGDVNPFEAALAQQAAAAEPKPQEQSQPVEQSPAPQEAPKPESQQSGQAAPEVKAQDAQKPEPVSAPEVKTSAALPPQSGLDIDPLTAAMAEQEARTEQKAAKSLFEKAPVFAYGSAKEEITDSGMTFEELRIAKADDFPELGEGKRVSWSVEYGKTTKTITDPKGTTIASVKAEIEQSKGFLDTLKKAKDKNPDCLVKPRVTAQSKGIASYKGVFTSLEEAQESDKAICLFPGGDGKVYELRKTELGEFIAPKNNVTDFAAVRAGFTPALPLVPMELLAQIVSFFRCCMTGPEKFEALAHILWDKQEQEFVVRIPAQSVTRAHIDADLSGEDLSEDRYLHYIDIFNPLYFIEELGNDGKNLLERHLPMIPHETVMAQLSDGTRKALEGENFPAPETYLKKKREEIRELEESIIYLRGQQDQAQSQDETQEQRVSSLTAQYDALTKELEDLEAKRFDGLDRKDMEQKLVELSARYDEAARDDLPPDAEILEIERKLAARRAEQYQPKYTQAIADANARLEQLGKQFNTDKKAFQFFKPGVACPTCRRLITEETLAEVRAALEKSSKEVLAAGHEQRNQLTELQALEAKAKAVFEQFQADDVTELEYQLDELHARKSEVSPADDLRSQIQQLNSDLEYGNLSEAEYARLKECREEQRDCAAQLAAVQAMTAGKQTDFDAKIKAAQDKITALKKLMSSVAVYVSKRAELTFSALKMNKVEISLYDIVKTTGERKDAFKFTYGGRRYDRLSLSEKIRAGMEVSELMKRLTGRNYPVFVDNMESVDDLANVRPTGQVIMAKCVRGTPLSVRPVKSIPVVEQQAA